MCAFTALSALSSPRSFWSSVRTAHVIVVSSDGTSTLKNMP